jgi:hypothetical protein
MKDRMVTVGGGLLAFAIVIVLLVPVDRDETEGVSRPLSADRGAAGLQGMKRWLEQGGVETDVLGRRYTALASDLELSPVGNLVVVSLPQLTPSRSREREALRTWLAQGNSALVLVAAGDAPFWMLGTGDSTTNRFLETLGFELARNPADRGREDVVDEEKKAQEDEAREQEDEGKAENLWSRSGVEKGLVGEQIELSPRLPHPLTRGVTAVSTWSLAQRDSDWYLTGAERGRAVLPLLARPGEGAAFWEARVGSGRMWVSRYSDLFANGQLAKADNGRLLANIVSSSLGRNGRVIFDDMHQGATDLYDAKAFFGDPRFISTLIFMVGFWLLYLIGRSSRLAPAREAVSSYYAADLARAMAGFFVRRLGAVTVERQLFVFFFNDIRSRFGLPTNGQPVWSILSGMSRVSADDINQLRMRYERTAARKPDLVSLARLMQRTRESLL